MIEVTGPVDEVFNAYARQFADAASQASVWKSTDHGVTIRTAVAGLDGGDTQLISIVEQPHHPTYDGSDDDRRLTANGLHAHSSAAPCDRRADVYGLAVRLAFRRRLPVQLIEAVGEAPRATETGGRRCSGSR